jgi:hypothetical protein
VILFWACLPKPFLPFSSRHFQLFSPHPVCFYLTLLSLLFSSPPLFLTKTKNLTYFLPLLFFSVSLSYLVSYKSPAPCFASLHLHLPVWVQSLASVQYPSDHTYYAPPPPSPFGWPLYFLRFHLRVTFPLCNYINLLTTTTTRTYLCLHCMFVGNRLRLRIKTADFFVVDWALGYA